MPPVSTVENMAGAESQRGEKFLLFGPFDRRKPSRSRLAEQLNHQLAGVTGAGVRLSAHKVSRN